jgi:hypothetical protein
MHPNQWAAAVGQAAGYISCMTPLSNGRHYGMVASGTGFVILEYSAGRGLHLLLKVTGGNLVMNKSHDTTPWDAQVHARDIDIILDAITLLVHNTS